MLLVALPVPYLYKRGRLTSDPGSIYLMAAWKKLKFNFLLFNLRLGLSPYPQGPGKDVGTLARPNLARIC